VNDGVLLGVTGKGWVETAPFEAVSQIVNFDAVELEPLTDQFNERHYPFFATSTAAG
jgi:hypothetical protein